MADLEQKIKEYADQYYQGNEQISDEEYDVLIDELRKENPESNLLPENQGIAGSDLKGVDKKYKLDITMGTLAKCNTDEQFEKWWNKHQHDDIVCELKIDGNGQMLHYENGKFMYARSRGDSEYGLDTTKIFDYVDIPKSISITFTGSIRGELVLKRSVWKKHFPDTKNPRNAAAGLTGRLDSKDAKYLTFIAYDVFDNNDNVDQTEENKLVFLYANSFNIPENKLNPTFDEIKVWKDSIDTANAEIPCDGIVIKQNKVDKDDLMRVTPENNVAYKPNLQTAVSTIKNIKWQLQGRYLSPLAIIEPVELEGTTVVRASLANVNKMNEKGVYIGAKVMVSKHGMIIPAIDSVINPKQNAFEIPEVCPRCGNKLVVNESGFPECLNEECIAKVEHQFSRFFDILGIKAAGPAFIEKAAATCGNMSFAFRTLLSFTSIDDKVTFNEWAGGINGEKILKQLREYITTITKEPKVITVAQFCAMFDYPHLSTKQFEKIPDFSLTKALTNIPYEELKRIDGIGDELADQITTFLSVYHDKIEDVSHFFNIEDIKKEESDNSLSTICFTGACPGYSRSQLTEMCKGKYTVVNSVTKDTAVLACEDPSSGSSKLQKAVKNGTKIISYDELLTDLL